MNENNNEQEQPLYKEQPWWVQIFVALYAMFWLTMIFAAGLNSLYIGKIDIDSVSMAVALTVGIYPLIKMLENCKMYYTKTFLCCLTSQKCRTIIDTSLKIT